MSQVSFYLIEKTQQRQVEIACRLCQQLYPKHRIWVYFQNNADCQSFDELLWQYPTNHFIPHGIDQIHAPICLSAKPPHLGFDLCINFSGQALNVTELFHSELHIIEIVGHNEQDKHFSRNVFKTYRQFGIEPIIHKI